MVWAHFSGARRTLPIPQLISLLEKRRHRTSAKILLASLGKRRCSRLDDRSQPSFETLPQKRVIRGLAQHPRKQVRLLEVPASSPFVQYPTLMHNRLRVAGI